MIRSSPGPRRVNGAVPQPRTVKPPTETAVRFLVGGEYLQRSSGRHVVVIDNEYRKLGRTERLIVAILDAPFERLGVAPSDLGEIRPGERNARSLVGQGPTLNRASARGDKP